MRAEEREPWDQWWSSVGERELRKVLAQRGLDARYIAPVLSALRAGATVPDLERLLPTLRRGFDDPSDEEADGACAVAAAIWWDDARSSRKRFGAA